MVYQSKKQSFQIELQHHLYEVEFREGNPQRYARGYGKHWPRVTQCLLYTDGELKYFIEVVKHSDDVDNQEFARSLALKKAFANVFWGKELRVKFWQLIGHPKAKKS